MADTENRQMETKTDTQHAILISVVVKESDRQAAEDHVTNRMNAWFNERNVSKDDKYGYVNGTLLHWNFYEPMVVNGR